MITKIVTIGVYGTGEAAFFEALQTSEVDTFCDIRARRGVRGKEYAFANSKWLQGRLAELGIRYYHFPELAPSASTRALQAEDDTGHKVAKRKRTELSQKFIASYIKERLQDFQPELLLETIDPAASVIALFCVEREPGACHRSLLAARLAQEWQVPVEHLRP